MILLLRQRSRRVTVADNPWSLFQLYSRVLPVRRSSWGGEEVTAPIARPLEVTLFWVLSLPTFPAFYINTDWTLGQQDQLVEQSHSHPP